MTLKETILKHKDDENFFETYVVKNKKFVVSIDEKELVVEVYVETGKESPKYESDVDLIINDWDDDDWEEFENFAWPTE